MPEIEWEGGKCIHTGSKLSMKLLCIDGFTLNANFINRAFSLTVKHPRKEFFFAHF